MWVQALRDRVAGASRLAYPEIRQDLRYSLRLYSRRPVVTGLAIIALALAIGATTGVFSVMNAVLLRSLPFRAPEELLQVEPPQGMESRSDFHRWRATRAYLSDAVTYDRADMNLGWRSESARVTVAETSSNFFAMLGATPVVGRGFAADEDEPGKNTVVVISYALWQQAFGGDVRALGSTLHLNGQPVSVVGVAPPAFDFPGGAAVWTPTTFDYQRLPKTRVTYWETVARLKPGISRPLATELFTREVDRDDPGRSRRRDQPPVGLVPLREQLAGPVRQASFVMFGTMVFVLLIACANVGHLLLSRTTERRSELALRAALGASRARLLRQLMTESLAVSLVATGLGFGVARWATALAAAAQPAALNVQSYTLFDWRVLAFAALLAALTTLAFGLVAASLTSGFRPTDALARTGGSAGSGARRPRAALVALQVALTIVLLAASVTMGRTFLALVGADLGFRTDGIVTMSVSLAGSRHESEELKRSYTRDALARLRAVPGVRSAAAVDFLPLASAMYAGATFKLDSAQAATIATVMTVTPGYFATMGTGVVYGREFTDRDGPIGERVCIVNDEFARVLGRSGDLVGRTLTSGRRETLTVVGVVRNMSFRGPMVEKAVPQVFRPYDQRTFGYLTFVARVAGNAADRVILARGAVQSVDREVPVFDARTLADRLSERIAKPRFYTSVIVFMATFAALLSMIGVYGVAAYSMAQRTHEIGIRVAVGASPGEIRAMFMTQGLAPVAVGAVVGVAGTALTGRFLEHLLATVHRVDAATSLAVGGLLVAVALVAIWSATERLTSGNPLDALRAE